MIAIDYYNNLLLQNKTEIKLNTYKRDLLQF